MPRAAKRSRRRVSSSAPTASAWVHQIPRITYENGDQCDYLDLTFRCDWVSGRAVSGRRRDDLGRVVPV